MFCRLGSDEDSRPVVVDGQREGGVHPPGVRVDIAAAARRCRSTFSFESWRQSRMRARQLVALRGQLLEHARRRWTTRPSRVLLAPRQAHLAEQDVAELLGRAEVERLAGELVDLVLQRRHALREIAGQPRRICRSMRMPARSMRASTGTQRPLQRLVDGGHAALRASRGFSAR